MQLPQFLTLFKRTNRNSGWFCVALGTRGVHFVQIKRAGALLQVVKCAFFQMENINPSSLEKIVREQRLGKHQFTTLLAPDEYQIMMVDAPNVPAEEMKTAIRYRIKDALNYHVDNAMVDVLEVPGSKGGGNRPQSVYAIAASNELIQKRIELFEKAKIDLSVIDIPEMAQRNIAALYETEGRGLALLAFDERGGLLTFTSAGELCLSRRLDVTSGQLQDANEDIREQYFDRVELEIQRSLDYFDRQFHQVSLSRMLVCAGDNVLLASRLASSLGLPVEPLDLSQVMDVSAVPELQDSDFVVEALPAIGAALRQERRAR